MTDFGMIIAVALLAMCGVYFLPKVKCFNKYRKNEIIDLDHWERMNNL